MARTITRADIAEIYEALGDPRAPLARLLADDEHAEHCGLNGPRARIARRVQTWLEHEWPDEDQDSTERRMVVTEVTQAMQAPPI